MGQVQSLTGELRSHKPHSATKKKKVKQCSYHLVNYKDFRNPESGTGVKGQILEQKVLLVLLPLRKLQGFKGLCARNYGQRRMYIISHFNSKKEKSEGKKCARS